MAHHEFAGQTLHVSTASNVGTDSVALEFRWDADDLEPLVIVEQFGDFGSEDVRVRTLTEVNLGLLLAIIAFAKREHGLAAS
jgi:hypothetical protein